MKLTSDIIHAIGYIDVKKTRQNLLQFVRTGKVPVGKDYGLCANFNILGLVKAVTGVVIPIKSEKPWITDYAYYWSNKDNGNLYKGGQLKQRRKLAIKLINVIDQYLVEQDDRW